MWANLFLTNIMWKDPAEKWSDQKNMFFFGFFSHFWRVSLLASRRIIFQSIIFDCYPEGKPVRQYSSLSLLCGENYIHYGVQLRRPCCCDSI